MFIDVCLYVCNSVYISVCMFVYIWLCVCVYIYTYNFEECIFRRQVIIYASFLKTIEYLIIFNVFSILF